MYNWFFQKDITFIYFNKDGINNPTPHIFLNELTIIGETHHWIFISLGVYVDRCVCPALLINIRHSNVEQHTDIHHPTTAVNIGNSFLRKVNIGPGYNVGIWRCNFIGAHNQSAHEPLHTQFFHNLTNQYTDVGSLLSLDYGSAINSALEIVGNSKIFIKGSIFWRYANISGIIYLHNCSEVLISNCIFENNKMGQGAVVNLNLVNQAKIVSCCFRGNNAENKGGILNVTNNVKLVINGSSFHNNRARIQGAVAQISYGCNLLVLNSVFHSNIAELYGGVLDIKFNSTFDAVNCSFRNNSAGQGAVIFASDNVSVNLSQSNFTSNEALTGGVVTARNNATFMLMACNISGNIAFRRSIIDTRSNVTLILIRNWIANNWQSIECSIYLENSTVSIVDSEILSHHMSLSIFGTILSIKSIISITNSTFTSNHNALYGSVLHCKNSIITIDDSQFFNNSGYLGGVIYLDGSKFISRNTNWSENLVTRNGGSLYALRSHIVLTNCNMRLNQAKQFGGFLYSVFSNISIFDSVLTQNEANFCGGGIFVVAGELDIQNTNITINYAGVEGSAIYTETSDLSIYKTEISSYSTPKEQHNALIYLRDTSIRIAFSLLHSKAEYQCHIKINTLEPSPIYFSTLKTIFVSGNMSYNTMVNDYHTKAVDTGIIDGDDVKNVKHREDNFSSGIRKLEILFNRMQIQFHVVYHMSYLP